MAVNEVFAKLVGTQSEVFAVGLPTGPKIKKDVSDLAIRNAADDGFANLKVASLASGAEASEVPTLYDLQASFPTIKYSFAGGAPSTPGDNTGDYGFCHTDGGAYTEGDVIYDDGAALSIVPTEVCTNLKTAVSVTGDTSLIQYGVYTLLTVGWHLVGDAGGGGGTGLESETFTYSDTSNKIAGPLSETPFDIAGTRMFHLGLFQNYTGDFTVRLVVGGSAPGYYLCIATDSTAPGGGAFSGGANPGTGITSYLDAGDKLSAVYETA